VEVERKNAIGSVWQLISFYRAVAITSQTRDKALLCGKKVLYSMATASRRLTHDLCAIFIGFTQCNNCAIAIINIIKA